MSLPSTVKALTIARQGDLDVIEFTEQPFPKVEPNHVVIKIEYGGVNFIDTYFRKGLYPVKEFPAIIGTEAAGVVVKLPTDENVLSNEHFKKRGIKLGGKVASYGLGAFSQYVSVPWTATYPIPESVSTRIAAASLTQGMTALSFITEAYDVKKGDTILIHTVAGGLGLLFTQLIKARGATVIGTTSTAEKAELAKAHGADHVILYKEEDTVKRVLELTGGKGVDAVFDGVGKDTFESNFEMLKRKGTLVSVGNASGAVPPMAPLKLVAKNLKLLRPTLNNYVVEPEEQLYYGTELFKKIEDGTLKIKIFKEFPFSAQGCKDSQIALTSGQSTGKVLIKIKED